VLLAGDAGVGKTRLLTELRDRAVDDGWQVLAGHCLDFADSALPYLPVLRDHRPHRPRAARPLRRGRRRHPALLRLLPGQRMLSQATDPESVPADQADLFDAVHALAEAVGAGSPLLLVVEDLHWADQSTRDLMSFLLARGFDGPVASSRPTAPTTCTAATRCAPPGRRVGAAAGVERLQLEPLARRRRTASWCAQLHPGPAVRPRPRDIVRRAEGNAFFVEELVGAAARTGGVSRTTSPTCCWSGSTGSTTTPVRWSAPPPSPAAGSPTSCSSAVVDLPPAELDEALREAVEHHVLVPSRRRRLRVPARAARRGGLRRPAARRAGPAARGLRRALLEDRRADGTAAELARHARAAHDLRRRSGPPASRPATRRCRSAAPTRPPSTTRRALRGDLEQAQAAYHLGALVAREAGRPWAPYGFEARLMEATVAYQRGAWDEAVELTLLAGQSPPPVAEDLLLSVRAAVYVGRGDPPRSRCSSRSGRSGTVTDCSASTAARPSSTGTAARAMFRPCLRATRRSCAW
jgi:hypothetical protein